MDILPLLATNLALALVLFAGLWGLAQINRDPSFVDAFWAFGITLMVVSSFWLADGWPPRQQVITALVVVWGVRLGLHMYLRWRHEGADRRYEKLLADVREKRGWSFGRTTAFFVFLPQAVLLWVTSLPGQLGQISTDPGFGVIAYTGIAIAVIGIAYEAIADYQLSRFKANPDNKGHVMDQGLWAWSRHPNYFAEALTWWGIWLIGAETVPGLFAVAGPAFLTFTLMRWSGVPMLEAGLANTRPAYADYVARVSPFFPWPPKRP